MPTLGQIASMLDHSMLQPFLTDEDIRKGCEVALLYETASVCTRPIDMRLVAKLLEGSSVAPCTVIGFPHGAHRSDVKLFEARRALDDGCTELDMVLCVGKLKTGERAYVQEDIQAICTAAHDAKAIVKVILETCYLTDEEIIDACKISEQAGADFVKTSTGYGSAGATAAHIRLMRSSVGVQVKIKASGGIRTLDSVLEMRAAGADRCGVSATEAIMQQALARAAEGKL